MSIEIPAVVEHVRFRNDSGFGILSASLNVHSAKFGSEIEDAILSNLKVTKYDSFAITVNMLKPQEKIEGQQCIFIGDFYTHPKYGSQFKAEFYYLDDPADEEGLQAYLMTLPNIKQVRSQEIINMFGVKGTIQVIEEDIYKLTAISGLTEQRIEAIKEKWEKDKTLRLLYMWLSEHGIGPKIGREAYALWGTDSKNVISENPYRLTDIKGTSFVLADNLAHKVLDIVPINYRIEACIKYQLTNNLYRDSNLCIPYQTLRNNVKDLLIKCDSQNEFANQNAASYLNEVANVLRDNKDLFTAVRVKDGNAYIYLTSIWKKEKAIAEFIYNRCNYEKKKTECTDQDIDMAEKDLIKVTGKNITLDDTQKQAVKSAFNHKVTIITGGGGTGKSTICRCIYFLAKQKRLSVRLMSPTGRAAQVLSDKTKGQASTIHRSLKMIPGDDLAKEQISEDIITVDEFSMVGIDTLYPMLHAMEENEWGNLIFVGDSNQLPSVSPGNFLSDIIESGCANVVKLDRIHRQDENSYISLLANKLAKGNSIEIPENASDLKWYDVNPDTFSNSIRDFVNYFIAKKDIADLQILAPMYKGKCGVNAINEVIQEMMAEINNTTDQFLKREFKYFHKGDRIIQTKNNYNKQIFNGDMGTIVDLGQKVIDRKKSDVKEDYVIVEFYNDEIMFIGDEINELQLAWCITIHKYQGSQSPYVVFMMTAEARNMMTKELVYTAFTRAEKYLIIYGNKQMLQIAPQKSVIKERYTNLKNMIIEMKENRKILEVLGE